MTIYTRLIAVFLASSLPTLGEIKMPAFFSDGMVLQQQTGAKVWGVADAGKSVKVEFAGQKLISKAGNDGKWMVDFKNLKMNKTGASMSITSGKDKYVIRDVVVGEVWLASGQSNMEWPMKRTSSAEDAKTANDPLLRVYVTKNVTAVEPVEDFPGNWKHTNPGNTPRFTAVGYEFAKNLREKLDVPVGIIECAWGGKAVEAFICADAIKTLPQVSWIIKRKAKMVAEWEASAKEDKKRNPSLSAKLHSTIYNGMIAPLAGYGMRGAIWYQGESNANPGTAMHYGELLKCLIEDWRKKWGSDFSFYYVQLANFNRKGPPLWATVQDEMRRLLDECDGVGMAVTNDIGDADDIHPKNKKDVGSRLALLALNKDYGYKEIIISGPLYKSHEIKGANVEVSFSYDDGMKTRDGEALGEFEILDAEGNWHPAKAKIVKGRNAKIVVSSKAVTKPSNVRYAWKSNPVGANLVNAVGLPASCFIGK